MNMKERFHLTKEERKLLSAAVVFLMVIFAISLVQNIIRYGVHATYNPWRSVLYLLVSLLLFLPFVPLMMRGCLRARERKPRRYWFLTVGLAGLIIFVYYCISSVLIHWAGFYDQFFAPVYARQYFGREALYHMLVLAGTCFYFYFRKKEEPVKMVSGMVGKKEVTIQANLIRWIEAYDHYLKIHAEGVTLLKRYTMERMSSELAPEFVRIHRKYLVNKRFIVGKERNQRNEFVLLGSGERIKVGRSYAPLDL